MKKETKQKTFITFRVKDRKRVLDFGNSIIYIYDKETTDFVQNKTKGKLDVSFKELHPFCKSKLRLLFKMLKAKNFVFAEIK